MAAFALVEAVTGFSAALAGVAGAGAGFSAVLAGVAGVDAGFSTALTGVAGVDAGFSAALTGVGLAEAVDLGAGLAALSAVAGLGASTGFAGVVFTGSVLLAVFVVPALTGVPVGSFFFGIIHSSESLDEFQGATGYFAGAATELSLAHTVTELKYYFLWKRK
ncbi:MAG: hypothetical protein KDJ28_03320 [Candidatus Competibacteraceae bacterium]|nr:hypothetical protein [Candidatus Competibacteraceae bacterium]